MWNYYCRPTPAAVVDYRERPPGSQLIHPVLDDLNNRLVGSNLYRGYTMANKLNFWRM